MRTWTTTEARRRLRDVLDAATEAPQRISRDGRGVSVVVMSEAMFSQRRPTAEPRTDIVTFFHDSPLADPVFDEVFDRLDREPRPSGHLRDVEW